MKIAIPVDEFRNLDSRVYGHFGSAPVFVIVDSDAMTAEVVDNRDRVHEHGACNPLRALAGAKPEVVITGGIGGGALMGLKASGIKVYQFADGTVAEAVHQFKSNKLVEIGKDGVCPGHGSGHSCHHG